MANERRSSWIDRILGRKGVSAMIASLIDELEKAGIATKQHGDDLTTKQKGILESLVADMDKVLAKLTDNPPEGLSNEIIAMVMNALQGLGEEETEPEPEPETMQEGEEEEDEEEIPEALMQLGKEVTRLSQESIDNMKAVGEAMQLFTATMTALKTLEDIMPQLDGIGNLSARMATLEKQFALRPRASAAASTALDDEAARKELERRSTKTVMGLAVKE